MSNKLTYISIVLGAMALSTVACTTSAVEESYGDAVRSNVRSTIRLR
jgi:hypothetical protein